MAVPKKKKSKSRSAMNRAHWHLEAPGWVGCPQCQEPMTLHHVCKACGYYKGRQVLKKKSA